MGDEELFNLTEIELNRIKENRIKAYIHAGEYASMLDWDDLTPREQRLAAAYFKN